MFSFSGNGLDVFGSNICTRKQYLVYAIEECIRGAQKGISTDLCRQFNLSILFVSQGGVGVVVYFRKERRALGEVTKCVSQYYFASGN